MTSGLEELTDILDRLTASVKLTSTDPPLPEPSSAPSETAEAAPESVVLVLPPAEALAGTRRVIQFTVTEPCSKCGGSGSAGSIRRRCRRCKGTGHVEIERQLRLRIPAGVEDGTKLLVHGEGGVAAGGSARDLFVQIQVRP